MSMFRFLFSAAVAAVPLTAQAANFDVAPGALTISGEIVPTDFVTLPTVLAQQREAGNAIRLVYLDSPGGQAQTAALMAVTLLQNDLATRVRQGATCASACFIMWQGGVRRSFENGSRLGVHRGRTNNDRDDDAGTAFAMRVEAYFGAPDGLLLRQQHTPWNDMAWATADDLAPIVHAPARDKDVALRRVLVDLQTFAEARKVDAAAEQPTPQPVKAVVALSPRPEPAWRALVGQPFGMGGHGEDGQGLTGEIHSIEKVSSERDGTLFRVNGGQQIVYCSLDRPGIAERSDGHLSVLPLDLAPNGLIAESNAWIGYSYLAACHGGGNPWDREALARLGYRDPVEGDRTPSPLAKLR